MELSNQPAVYPSSLIIRLPPVRVTVPVVFLAFRVASNPKTESDT
jgi:hypothetical protein